MRFLVDESTGRRLHNLLIRSGHDSIFAGDDIHGTDDELVLAKAQNQERILITDDKDFGELIFRRKRPSTGVIFLRIGSDPSARLRAIKEIIKSESPKGKFITVTEGRFKIRKL